MKRRLRQRSEHLALLASVIFAASAQAGWFDLGIDRDEFVEFSPTYATYDAKTRIWKCRVSGCVYEVGRRSDMMRFVVDQFFDSSGVPEAKPRGPEDGDEAAEITAAAEIEPAARSRDQLVRRIFVDTESWKRVVVHIGEQQSRFDLTDDFGRFNGVISVPNKEVMKDVEVSGLRGPVSVACHAVLPRDDKRDFVGTVYAIPPAGLSVISDIDDTIRVTGVGSLREMLRNTFRGDFVVVPGMPETYSTWQDQYGAAFHYVSNGPWPLSLAIDEFLEVNGFPRGSLHLQNYSFSLGTLYRREGEGKEPDLRQILADFPHRKFVFVGDTGEHDPIIYADLMRKHPDQILKTFILLVSESDVELSFLEAMFEGVPREKWQVVRSADEMKLEGVLPRVESRPTISTMELIPPAASQD